MRAPARRFSIAALTGALAALPIELTLLLGGRRFFAYEPLADVYDAQARALLDGRWELPPEVIRLEAFLIDGRSYTYFGPAPTLLRMPVVAFTDALDGRLARLSLLLAWTVTMTMVARFAWRARPDREAVVSRREAATVAAFVFVVGAGSSVTFLTARPGVYHEAIGWGIALSLVGLDAVLRWRAEPTLLRLAVAGLACTAALLTRASVGAGPVAALGIFLLVDLIRRAPLRKLAPVALAVVLPAASYVAVNYARFGTFVKVPYEWHLVLRGSESRHRALVANGGTIQGPQFLPTTLVHYVRPDAIGFDANFPWIDFPRDATVIPDSVVMDSVDVAASVPSSMPALTVVGVFGGVALVRRRRDGTAVGVAALGAAACIVVTLTIGFVAHRYTGDAMPLLVLTSATGLYVVRPWERAARGAALAALAAVSVFVTAALTIQFQRHDGFLTPMHLRADLASTQLSLPGRTPTYVRFPSDSRGLGPPEADGVFAVVGGCDGLYRSDGAAWQPLEPVGRTRERVTLATRSLPGGIAVRPAGVGTRVVLSVHGERSRPIAPGSVDVVTDYLRVEIEVRRDGDLVLVSDAPDLEVVETNAQSPVCQRVVREGQARERSS